MLLKVLELEHLDSKGGYMTEEERAREKEIKYLMFLKSELIRQTKRELSQLRDELNNLGDNKVLRKERTYNGKRK